MNRIRELREEKMMKQAELARLLSVKPQSVSRYELGVNDLDTDTIRRLCLIFEVSADYLLGWSLQRRQQVSDADAQLVFAYHAASDRDREIVDRLLGLGEQNKNEKAAVG